MQDEQRSTDRQLSQLKYPQEAKGKTEVDIPASFPGEFYSLTIMEGGEITKYSFWYLLLYDEEWGWENAGKDEAGKCKEKKTKCKHNTKSTEGEDQAERFILESAVKRSKRSVNSSWSQNI